MMRGGAATALLLLLGRMCVWKCRGRKVGVGERTDVGVGEKSEVTVGERHERRFELTGWEVKVVASVLAFVG